MKYIMENGYHCYLQFIKQLLSSLNPNRFGLFYFINNALIKDTIF